MQPGIEARFRRKALSDLFTHREYSTGPLGGRSALLKTVASGYSGEDNKLYRPHRPLHVVGARSRGIHNPACKGVSPRSSKDEGIGKRLPCARLFDRGSLMKYDDAGSKDGR